MDFDPQKSCRGIPIKEFKLFKNRYIFNAKPPKKQRLAIA